MAVKDQYALVQKLYVAFYQRPADPAGLEYWSQRIDAAGGNATETINAFANSAESQGLYGEITSATVGAVIDAVYQALFGVAPDAAGRQFYVDGFTAGTFNAGTLALDILNGARNDDAVAINNKLNVANQFTQQVDGRAFADTSFGFGTNFAVTYGGDADAAAARTLLATVNSNPATVLNADGVKTALQTQIADAGDPILSQTPGQTFALTAGPDNRTGTAGDDVFDGASSQSQNTATPTLNSFDNLNGGMGTDTVITGPNQGGAGIGSVADVDFTGVQSVERLIASTAAANTITLGVQAQRAGIAEVIASGGANITLAAGYTNDTVKISGGLGSIDQVNLNNGAANTNYRVTFTSAEVGNGNAMDGSATAPQDGGLAVRLQKEDGSDGLTGGVSRLDDEGVSFTSADATVRFDVRDISGTARGTFQGVVLGTQAADAFNNATGASAGQAKDISVYVNGGAGNDSITSGTANDFLVGGAGDDQLFANAGNNSVLGGAGNDAITAAGGNDMLDGGAGNDTITGGAGNDNVTGGAGDDLVNLTIAGDLTINDTIEGGDGIDTVAFVDADDFTAANVAARVTGFERLQANAGDATAYRADRIAGITEVVANHNSDDTVTFSNLSAAQSLRLTQTLQTTKAAENDNVTATLATDTSADTINVTIGATTATGTTGSAAGTLTLDNYETINIASTGGTAAAVNSIAQLASTNVTSITITGDRALTLTNIATGANNNKLDASALTANLNQKAALDGTGAHTVLGGAGNDTLVSAGGNDSINGGAGNDDITANAGNNNVDGGAGNDTITAGTGNDVLAGGDGDDVITGGTGNDNITGGAGNDAFVVQVNTDGTMDLTKADTLNGGDGTDVVRLTFAAATAPATTTILNLSTNTEDRLTNISNLEGFQIAANADNGSTLRLGDIALGAFTANTITINHAANDNNNFTLDLGAIVNNSARVNYTGNDGVTAYTVGNNIDNANFGDGNDTVTVANAVFLQGTDTLNGGAGADVLTVNSVATNVAITAAQLANVSSFETLRANFAAGQAGNLSLTLTDAVAQANRNLVNNTLAVTVTEGGGTGALTVDGSAVSAGVNLSLASSLRADTLTGGSGNDTIVAAANTLVLGESLTGGTGTDTLSFTGNNSLTGTTITGFETINFNDGTVTPPGGAGAVIALTGLASVLNGQTYAITESDTANNVNTITLTANGATTLDFSKITVASGNFAEDDQIIVNYSIEVNNNTLANTYIGSGLADVVTGGGLADTISGGAGADILSGGAGADVLNGGAGADVITGDAGADTITLGGGTDTLVFNSTTGADTITDYVVADDSIQLSKTTFAALTTTATNPLTAAEFTSVANAAALTGGSVAGSTNAQQIIYLQDTGALYYNADGATAGGLTLIGTFTGAPALVVGEFTVIA